MSRQLTAEDTRQSLNAHAAQKGTEVQQKYGPIIGWNELLQILEDRSIVRYPCAIEFDQSGLNPGEFAHPAAKTGRPEEGFTMYVHPLFRTQLERVPWLVLYQLVVVNYGAFTSSDDAETFGACALGIPRDDYYLGLCGLADQVGETPPP